MKQMYCHRIGRFYGSIFFQVLVDDDAQEAIMLHRTPIRFEILLKQLGTIFLLVLIIKKYIHVCQNGKCLRRLGMFYSAVCQNLLRT